MIYLSPINKKITMSLTKQEIILHLKNFKERWKDEGKERSESQTFWNELFEVFGHDRRQVASYEEKAKKITDTNGRIDLFWEGTLVVEHKSHNVKDTKATRVKKLKQAIVQAKEYLQNLSKEQLPSYLVVCDFQTFIIENLDLDRNHPKRTVKFSLENIEKDVNIKALKFFTDFKKTTDLEEYELNRKATDILTKFYKALLKDNHEEHDLKILIVRIMFCLFAEDTEIFEDNQFYNLLINHTKKDGSDVGGTLIKLFETLDTPKSKRSSKLDTKYQVFEYINGKLFKEKISIPYLDSKLRTLLLKCCEFDWRDISPVIFGSMFQNISKDRDVNAVHYTSEVNIKKVIDSLFLDELKEELSTIIPLRSIKELNRFHKKISSLTFLDPACGCGNFLICTYKELRLLEIDVLLEKKKLQDFQLSLDINDFSKVRMENFYGIELLDFPPMVAELSMWLIDHIMNEKLGESFGRTYKRIPLESPLPIIKQNALRYDWNELIPSKELNYIIGNPPFIGSKKRGKKTQKEDLLIAMDNQKGVAECDYVAAWFWKAIKMWELNDKIRIGLVTTNSLTSGQQIELLWKKVFERFKGIEIFFAHKTFAWANLAKGKASVYCNILGLKTKIKKEPKMLFEYSKVNGKPKKIKAKQINPYLMDMKFIPIISRTKPFFDLPKMNSGNMPLKAQSLIFDSEKDVNDFLDVEPQAKKFIKPLISSKQFLHNKSRYCLWLVGIEPYELQKLKHVKNRVELVRQARLKTPDKAAVDRPHEFRDTHNPKSFIVIPRHSSENRKYIPMKFFDDKVIPSDSCSFVWTDSLYIFGLLQSYFHMLWMSSVGGKLESRYRYSKEIIYNNFPTPSNVNEKQKNKIEELSNNILITREKYKKSSLSDLYASNSLAIDLKNAHSELDREIEKLYKKAQFKDDKERIEFLFNLYENKVKGTDK